MASRADFFQLSLSIISWNWGWEEAGTGPIGAAHHTESSGSVVLVWPHLLQETGEEAPLSSLQTTSLRGRHLQCFIVGKLSHGAH